MNKICYCTTKPSSDVRVFQKECRSLARNGYDVYLVSPNARDAKNDNVNILGVDFRFTSEFSRLFVLPYLLYKRALKTDADIFHFNDPSFLPYGIKLKGKGKRVIFDSFEDHPTLLLEHKKVPKILLNFIIQLYLKYELYACRKFDAVISCYHWTHDRLSKVCLNSHLIFNFPIINKKNSILLDSNRVEPFSICYAGLLSPMWNIDKIIFSLSKVENLTFNLAGHGDYHILDSFSKTQGWDNVNFLGKISHEDVFKEIYFKSDVGMALLDYIPMCRGNFGNMSNNKLFEYMMAGLPVICTDFVLWKEVVEENECGICVNPNSLEEIIEALLFLRENKEIAIKMGQNGRKIAEHKYNWNFEEIKLLELYDKVINE